MAELHSCYPSSPSDIRKHLKMIDNLQRKWDEIRESPPALTPPPVVRRLLLLLLRTFGRELPDIGRYQEVHHRLITLLHGEQLRDLHVSASARSPSRCFPHLFPEHFLLVFPSAAVAEEMFPRLGRSAAPPAFVVVSVSEPFQVRAHWCVSRLQSVESGCQWLHTIHWNGSLAPSFAFQPVAMMLTALVGLPLSLCRRLCF